MLTEEYVLDKTQPLLHCVRECNVAIRWLMLHRRAKSKRVGEGSDRAREAEQLLLLLMNTAQLEYQLRQARRAHGTSPHVGRARIDLDERLARQVYTSLLDSKESMWEQSKSKVEESLTELADFFSGEKTLTRVGRDAQLREWFLRLAEQVRSLASSDSTATGRKVHHLITALSEVEQFHQIESALQLKQFLAEARRPHTARRPRRRGVTRPPSLSRRCARCSSA